MTRTATQLMPATPARQGLTATALEIFSGAGGLAVGLSRAGYRHMAMIDSNADACATLRLNAARGFPGLSGAEIVDTDIRDFDFTRFQDKVDLLAGGPPCQPFSMGGKRRGRADQRDMFPQAIRAIREVQPKVFVFENVRGIIRPAFSNYLEYLKLQMSFPDVTKRKCEKWTQHRARLERMFVRGKDQGYRLVFHSVNAADYGTPQRRERVFFVGIRTDLGLNWNFPEPTHSRDSLLSEKWVSGRYWDRHGINRPSSPPGELKAKLADLRDTVPTLRPWRTVRDAFLGLPNPSVENSIEHHEFVAGARRYPGHTGSPWDEPAKTLKAGDHGVPGGENMLQHQNGKVRYFTIRECARLQDLPDVYGVTGAWGAQIKQLGNAVPSNLGETIGASLLSALGSRNSREASGQ